MITFVVAFVPIGTQVFDTHGIHVKGRKKRGFVVTELLSVSWSDVNIGTQSLRHAVIVQLPEIFVETPVLLQHVDDVVDVVQASSRRRRRWRVAIGRRIGVALSHSTAAGQYPGQQQREHTHSFMHCGISMKVAAGALSEFLSMRGVYKALRRKRFAVQPL